ncbi:hypothetical protein QYE76_050158 [Lolium multiflorum]|uniref:Transposase (putative) gypsy type domain-containing protein n=1 Tax=Lolium multiflorum TaxID=4521 RepID=A0AAD8SQE3_LOLMU|nr:hypothetical protein QYE76_050158 [Lolium multiflorum]
MDLALTTSSPETFKRRCSKVHLNPSGTRLIGKRDPTPICGLVRGQCVKSATSSFDGITGNSHTIAEFFLSVLSTYGLQPHNICPNSYLLLSNFTTLCEGYLGVCPDVRLFQFFYRVKKETKDKVMLNFGSMTFVLRTKRVFPALASHESIRYWNAGWFYVKNVSVPGCHDGLPAFNNNPPEELASWIFIPNLS